MKNTPTYSHCISSFEGNSCIKICKMSHQSLIFSFILVFTSADIIFHKFLELHSTLSARKIFIMNLPSLMDPLKPSHPTPLSNSQNLLSVMKLFCQYSLNIVMVPGKNKKSFQRPFSLH